MARRRSSARLQEHPSVRGDRPLIHPLICPLVYPQVECALVEVESKSVARDLEARAIRRLQQLGIGRVRNVANA